MEQPELACQILQRLKELGVGLSCDDFGTGHSSLSSLRKLPFDTLKVDRSFVAPDATDRRAAVILEAVVAMAHAMGLTIVAEGIENQEQVDRLGVLDCDLGQGFFIGRPMTAKQVTEALVGLPYTASRGRTAITWLWERAAKDPAPAPVTAELMTAAISSAQPPMDEAPVEETLSEVTVEPAEENETVKATVPPLGSAPKAPRTPKPAEQIASEVEQPLPIEPEKRPRRTRKRRKRVTAEEQEEPAAKKLPPATH
jgi:hypothetical protein